VAGRWQIARSFPFHGAPFFLRHHPTVAQIARTATLSATLGIPRSTFYLWYERYLARGAGALEDCQPAPRRVWNKLPDTVAGAVVAAENSKSEETIRVL
jgi:hypothetical protein